MEDLTRMTAAELVELHNARADASARIDGPWKRGKAELIERIRAVTPDGRLGDAEADDAEATVAETAAVHDAEPRTTVRALAESLLAGADASVPLTYEEIAERVREAIPGSAPTPQSVRWYATKMRKRGETVRVRRVSRKGAVT